MHAVWSSTSPCIIIDARDTRILICACYPPVAPSGDPAPPPPPLLAPPPSTGRTVDRAAMQSVCPINILY